MKTTRESAARPCCGPRPRPTAGQRLGVVMITIGICLLLYETGLVGPEDRPLHPDRIGTALAAAGIVKWHVAAAFGGAAVAAALLHRRITVYPALVLAAGFLVTLACLFGG